MKETITKQSVPFTMVANAVLSDPCISLKAKGIYAYIYSKPDGWDFSGKRMAVELKEGSDAIYAALNELEDAGYLKREKLPSGKVEYKIYLNPIPENPEQATDPVPGFPKQGKSLTGKTRNISNTIEESKKEKKVKPEDRFLSSPYYEESVRFAKWFSRIKPEGIDDGPQALDKWAREWEKIRRIDGIEKEEAKAAIQWARQDDFWSKNFLTPMKLRLKNPAQVPYIRVFIIAHKAATTAKIQKNRSVQETTFRQPPPSLTVNA